MSNQKKKIAHVNDLSNGEIKKVAVNDDLEVVLAKVDGAFFAVYGKCTHYGAPLGDGALNGNRLICPWHHACFDIKTGKHLEAPGIDGLQTYDVTVEGDSVWMTVPENIFDRIPNKMNKAVTTNREKYVVIGGGAAGAYAVEGIREAGFTGHVIMVSKEDEVPYDRPNCSKDYLADEAPEAWMPLRDKNFYEDYDIQLMLGKEVRTIDVESRSITFHDGEQLVYDKLLLCTGGTPRQLNIDGIDLENIYTLRSLADSRRIREVGKQVKKAVVIGSSFIGLEGAQSLQQLDCAVTVVAPEEVPFGKIFGNKIGKKIKQWHEDAGITFKLGRKVQRFAGNQKVERVILDNGETIEADLVLVGIGVQPATQLLQGIQLAEDGGVPVDAYLAANEHLYAAGDVAHYPYDGATARIEHWKVAAQQGRIAGMNMAGKKQAYAAVPFFWTIQQGTPLQYVGHVRDFDDIIFDGAPDGDQFIAFYTKNNEPKAALGMGRDKDLAIVQELMYNDQMPDAAEIKAGVDWQGFKG